MGSWKTIRKERPGFRGRYKRMGYSGWFYDFPLRRKEEALKLVNTDIYEILKSVMVGSVCYAACRAYEENDIFGVIIPTKIDNGMIFANCMSENCGPVEDRCPASILKMLSSPRTEEGRRWRERCYKRLDKPSLSDLPTGSFILADGVLLQKRAPAYQFKTPWFNVCGTDKYVKKSCIDDYELLREEEVRDRYGI